MFAKIVLLQFYCWEGHGTLLYATQHTPNPISNKANHCAQVNLTKIQPLSTNHFLSQCYHTKQRHQCLCKAEVVNNTRALFNIIAQFIVKNIWQDCYYFTPCLLIFLKKKKRQISSLIFLLWVSLLKFSEICKEKQYLKLIDLPRNNPVLWIIIFPIPWIEILMQPVLPKIWPFTSKNTHVVPSLCFINI